MNKKFLSAILFGALMVTSTSTFVSCKDYDDDINGLQEQVDSNKTALESQITSLQTALTAAQSSADAANAAATAAKTAADKAQTAADKAAADVVAAQSAAQAAVATAKAEAIAAAKADAEALLANYATTADVEEAISELAGKIDGIEEGLSKLQAYDEDIKSIAQLKSDLATQAAAVKNLQDAIGENADLTGVLEAIEALQAKADAAATAADLETVKTDLGALITRVSAVETSLTTLHTLVDQITSLAIIPQYVCEDHFVPVIGFYNVLKEIDGEKVQLASSNTKATYRVNPHNVKQDDYTWSFINRVVETRAAGDNSNLISIVKSEAATGSRVFTLNLDRDAYNDALENANQYNIVALKATTGDGREIYSDYAQVEMEDLENFALAQLDEDADFDAYYPTTLPLVTEDAVVELVYNDTEGLDLKPITELWEIVKDKALADFDIDGITYEFSKAKNAAGEVEYLGTDGVTDQQKFVTLENGVVKVDNAWLAQGTASVGRTPVIYAVAKVNGTKVAEGYIKINIVLAPTVDKTDKVITVDCGTIEYTSIDATTGNIYEFSWDRANAEVYDALGLTRAQFNTLYTLPANSATETGVTAEGLDNNNSTTTATAMTSIVIDNTVKFGAKKAVVTYTSTDRTLYPNVVIEFNYNIVHTQTLPELNPDYLIGTNIIKVKGRMEGTKWALISDMKEHFKNYLTDYTVANHGALKFAFKVTNPAQVGAEITGTDYTDQVIKLTTPLAADEAYRDYTVEATATLANGEKCVKEYVVRFVRPFNVTVNEMKLKTFTANADEKDLEQLVVITDLDNKEVYKDGTWTLYGKDTYKLDQAGVTFDYSLDADASFGSKLTQTGSKIKWYNGGADLQQNKTAASVVTVTVPEIATIETEGVITVLSTENSKN